MQLISGDMAVIRERMLEPMASVPHLEPIAGYQEGLLADGSWPDVNYGGASTSNWEPAAHLSRLQLLTQAWYAPGSPLHSDSALSAEIDRALDCWLRKDPRRRWWWDAIGAPGMLSYIMLMRDGHLGDLQMSKGCDNLSRAQIESTTGQNMVWQAEITARRAVLQRDDALLRRAFDAIASEIRVEGEEGIQPDFSFHQHGSVLYNHGYGAGFAADGARLARLTADTTFEYPRERLDLLARYILDGSQWMTHAGELDFSALGREITRTRTKSAGYLADAALDMLALPTGREEEFRALALRASGKQAPPLVGNRHFYSSDFMVHHRGDWYMSARMYSTRTFNTDGLSGTDEGYLSHYLAEGATTCMRHGNEYRQLFAVWDWQRVPGTTVEMAPHTPGEPKRSGETPFAGGVSDGRSGVAAFELKRDALSGRKAWFFFSDAVVCLGAAIRCTTDAEIITTLNQCRLSGPVVTDDGTSHTRADTTQSLRWVHHDGIGYVFPHPQTVQLAAEVRTGDWKRISRQSSGRTITDSVFTLSISHGTRPANEHYAYTVFPSTDASEMAARSARLPYDIIANSEDLQAVWSEADGLLGIAFHRPGTVEAAGWRLAVDRPCLLLLGRAAGNWRLFAADLQAGSGILNVTLTREGSPPRPISLTFPDGLAAGSSVSTDL